MTGATPPPVPGRYAGPALIGAGGMAEVYRATDLHLGREVAVKVLAARLAGDPDHRRRFEREARAVARIRSPHVAAIYDVGEWEGRPYIVMELVPGGSLAERLARGPVPVGQALGWVAQAAAAIDAAHAEGVVHRDVTPSNLMLTSDGLIKAVDFGIARVLEGEGSATITATGTLLGTAGYLSPEQARGERGGPASDVYALAVVAYELLTGARPFAGRSAPAELAARLREPPPPASGRRPELPPAVDPAFARALAVDPGARPADARAFAAQLAEAATRTPTARAPVVPEVRRSSRRLLAVGGGAAAAVIALAAALVGAFGTGGGDGGGADAAERPAAPAPRAAPASAAATTTPAPKPKPKPTPAPAPARGLTSAAIPRPKGRPPSLDHARRMTDDAWAEIERGRPEKAVRLMQRAVPALAGSGDPYEGYALYNLGRGLLDLGACDQAVPSLTASLARPGSRAQLAERAETLRRARACG